MNRPAPLRYVVALMMFTCALLAVIVYREQRFVTLTVQQATQNRLITLNRGLIAAQTKIAKTEAKIAKEANRRSILIVRKLQGEPVPGLPGRNGVNGAPGLPGGAGPMGERGAPGSPGVSVIGPQGPAGAMGLPGRDGASASAIQVGVGIADYCQAHAGCIGAQGPMGVQGPMGAAGSMGVQGDPGKEPATITITVLGIPQTCTDSTRDPVTGQGTGDYACAPTVAPAASVLHRGRR